MQKILYLFWFLEVIFGLTGALLCHRNLLKSRFFCQNFNFFYRFCNLFVFSFYRMGFLVQVSDLLVKLHQICWFSGCDLHLPEAPGLRKPLAILQKTSKNFRNLCILEKFWRFFENLVSFLAFHITDWHSSPKEMIFMKKSIRFAGFLAVFFTCQ